MNRALFKLICSAVAVVAAAGGAGSQAFAQTSKMPSQQCMAAFQQGDDGLMMNQFPAAYNTPGSIMTKGGWDMFFDASFIYWHISQENMDVAKSAVYSGSTTSSATANPAGSTTVLFQDTKYTPGFKAGFGFNTGYDGWVASAEYTWIRQTTTTSANAPAPTAGTGTWVPNGWFSNAGVVIQAANVHSKWKLHMDLIDASLSRPFYQGRDLTILPYAGLRSMFLRQALNIGMTSTATPTNPLYTSENISQSWSIGPNAGMNAHWIVGSGFRFEGFSGASILYTRYTKIAHDEHDQGAQSPVLDTATLPFVGTLRQLGELRPVVDAGVGLGWGGYFSNQNYHFDLLARYDFMIAWNQNVMRGFVGDLASFGGRANNIGNLYLHGLTATARFDF